MWTQETSHEGKGLVTKVQVVTQQESSHSNSEDFWWGDKGWLVTRLSKNKLSKVQVDIEYLYKRKWGLVANESWDRS